jgi:hypothetical protein
MEMPEKKNGIVAILDALGAASYDDKEIKVFLQSRKKVRELLEDKAGHVADRLDVAKVETYTFNDTMLIVLESKGDKPTRNEIDAFVTVLRKLLIDSLSRKIMFRGSFAIGSFYGQSNTNTILGKAVTDAAAWYDKADWIGILATPRTTIFINQMKEQGAELGHLLIEYEVPLTGDKNIRLHVVNWPKGFWVNSITPCRSGEKPREAFLRLLSQFYIPRGAESKHFNTISFFDHVSKHLNLKNKPVP